MTDVDSLVRESTTDPQRVLVVVRLVNAWSVNVVVYRIAVGVECAVVGTFVTERIGLWRAMRYLT